MKNPITVPRVEGRLPKAPAFESATTGLSDRKAVVTAPAEKPDTLDANPPGREGFPHPSSLGRIPVIVFSAGPPEQVPFPDRAASIRYCPFDLRNPARHPARRPAPPPSRCLA